MEEKGLENVPSFESEKGEILSKWLEIGYTPEAVAAYGTSVENLRNMLQVGKILEHPSDNSLPYQDEIRKMGKFIYYFIPLGDNLKRENPTFYQKVLDNTVKGGEESNTISITNGIEDARMYAKMNAHVDFLREHGVSEDYDNIEFALDEDLYRDAENIIQEKDSPSIVSKLEKQLKDVDELKIKLKSKGVLESLGLRKGVLIYFDKEIFEGSIAHTGEETFREFILSREKPMSLDVISGIEVYSEEERRELLK